MSSTQARAFHAVATAGSFTGAAKALNVSQPTVTTQVKALEELYGVELFHRHARGVTLTSTGRTLLDHLRHMYARQNEAIEYLEAVQGLRTGSLRIGAYGPYEVIGIVAELKRRYPGLDISVKFANSNTLQDELLSHDLDVAVFGCSDNRHEFHRIPYIRLRLSVIVSRHHPWSRRKSVRLKDLAKQHLIIREPRSEARRILEEATKGAGVTCDNVMEIESREGVVAAVAQDIGVGTICDEGFLPDHLVTKLRVSGADIAMNVDIVCLSERKDSRSIGAFLEVAQALRAPGIRRKTQT